MPRPPRIQQNEYPYHVTTRTNGRKLILKKWTYKIIIKVLCEVVKKYNTHIHHFKMMDNHYHLITSTPNANISEIMWYINNQIAKRINKRLGKTGHLWGERFFGTIIETGEHALRAMCYLYTNGVRAGLCKKASEDDKMSTFEFYARGKKLEFIVVEDEVYLLMGCDKHERQNNFIRLIDQSVDEQFVNEIRISFRKMFYGSADFIQRMRTRYLS